MRRLRPNRMLKAKAMATVFEVCQDGQMATPPLQHHNVEEY